MKKKKKKENLLLSCHIDRIESANACREFYGRMLVNAFKLRLSAQ